MPNRFSKRSNISPVSYTHLGNVYIDQDKMTGKVKKSRPYLTFGVTIYDERDRKLLYEDVYKRQGEACGLAWQDVNLEEQCLTIRRSIRSVSYTHLDVYKRQGLFLLYTDGDYILFPGFFQHFFLKEKVGKLEDVYKRQDVTCHQAHGEQKNCRK